jgi:integrase
LRLFLDVNQIRQFLELARPVPRDYALFHLSFSTGLRISDLLALQRSNLMEKDGTIVSTLRRKMIKTKQWIERPLREDCREAMATYLRSRTDDNPFLFPAFHKNQFVCHGRALNRRSAQRIYKKYLRLMGFTESMLAGSATHTARRSMAKIISDKAGRIEPACRFLGHASIASTEAYIDMNGYETAANSIVTEIVY